MMSEKYGHSHDAVLINGEAVADSTYLGVKTGTARDAHDMHRMGKAQEFRRNFNTFTILSLTAMLIFGWEAILGTVAFGLLNGGTAGLIYDYIAVAFLFCFVNLSLAEMASMAPTSGGQYHWVSEFAPRRLQKQISYLIGWLCVIAWQCGLAGNAFLCGTFVQGMILLNNPDYVARRWHGTLLAIAFVVFVATFCIVCARLLPHVEALLFMLHTAGWVAIVATLWALAPRASSHAVWTEFVDGGGWGSTGLSCLVGTLTPIYSLIGIDAAVHMAEEVTSASKTLPRSMIGTTAINLVLGFTMLITFVYTIGDVAQVTSTPYGLPIIQVFYNTTNSKAGTTGMTFIILALYVGNAITNMACASRQLFAFARDGGVPFHAWIAKVKWDIPVNSILAGGFFCCCLFLISLGSTTAFNQIISLAIGALLSSYCVSIGCVALKRIRGEPLLPSYFSLGKLGLPINLIAMAFTTIAFVFSFFPVVKDPTLDVMNWSSVIYVGVLTPSFGYYLLFARYHYVGPVEYVNRVGHVQL